MKTILFLLVISGSSLGVEFNDLYRDDVKLYERRTQEPAGGDRVGTDWQKIPEEFQVYRKTGKKLKIDWWYRKMDQKEGASVQLATDQLNNLAAIRLLVPKGNNEAEYKNSKIFEEKTIFEKQYYVSTVFFTLTAILTGSGKRRVNLEDPIVQEISIESKNDKEEALEDKIQIDACNNIKHAESEGYNWKFKEQGCEEKYGYVFSPIEGKSCDYPLFLIFNEEKPQQLLGLGWLVSSKEVKDTDGGDKFKSFTENKIKNLFPEAHNDCVNGKTAVTIWLAKNDAQFVTCAQEGHFSQVFCQSKFVKKSKSPTVSQNSYVPPKSIGQRILSYLCFSK